MFSFPHRSKTNSQDPPELTLQRLDRDTKISLWTIDFEEGPLHKPPSPRIEALFESTVWCLLYLYLAVVLGSIIACHWKNHCARHCHPRCALCCCLTALLWPLIWKQQISHKLFIWIVKAILILFFVKHIRESKREEKIPNKILLAPPKVTQINYHTLSGAWARVVTIPGRLGSNEVAMLCIALCRNKIAKIVMITTEQRILRREWGITWAERNELNLEEAIGHTPVVRWNTVQLWFSLRLSQGSHQYKVNWACGTPVTVGAKGAALPKIKSNLQVMACWLTL